jgi:hypothetical protein
MVKRFGIVLLAVAVIVGLTMQVVPRGLALESGQVAVASMDMPCDGGSGTPCKGMTPACIDLMGCVVAVAIPARAPDLTTFPWLTAGYTFTDTSLSGLSVQPELTPPILLA